MQIGGLQRTSLIDYPGKIAAIVFTQGCNFKCPYCHNPELVYQRLFNEPIGLEDVFAFLEKRKGLLDALVISGGEPLLQDDIEGFVRTVKDMGYAVKLDTNGTQPERLKRLLDMELLDYIAIDYKAPIDKYNLVAKADVDVTLIRTSISNILQADVSYVLRSTLFNGLTTEDVMRMIDELSTYGVRNYYIQLGIFRKTQDQQFIGDISLISEALQRNFSQWGLINMSTGVVR